MNYEKKYNEALEMACNLYAGVHSHNKAMLEQIFPELRESEDEKMMNQLHSWMMEFGGAEEYAERAFQWLKGLLEKQKDAFENGRQLGIMQEQARQELEWPDEKQKEQKSTDWNKEEERVRKGLIEVVSDITGGWPFEKHRITKKEALAYLEKQKDHFRDDTKMVEQKPVVTHGETYHVDTLGTQQVISGKMPQKPAEWSEEDDKMMKSVLWVLESYVSKNECGEGPALTATYPTYFKEIAWLKSLRPQPHWKPSKVQMNYLSAAVIDAKRRNDESTSGFPRYHVLKEIYEELLKL